MKPRGKHRESCPAAFDRRAFLRTAGALTALAALGEAQAHAFGAAAPAPGNLPGMPGRYPGRVVEVQDPNSVTDGVPNAEAVRAMVQRGVAALTGIDEPVEAWRSMFEKGDVVGIKVNPVGQPFAISNFATVHAIVEGLKSAGVNAGDIIVYDRYKNQFQKAGYEANLPSGCRWDWAAPDYDQVQLDLFEYDPDVFVTLDIVDPRNHDPKDERTKRSHVAKFLTKKINKLINIPVLKDHGSGGVTLALKNMSHGLVSNVNRSHGSSDTNTCNLFIPAICAYPVVRQKAVLQVLDGLNAVFHRGPAGLKRYVWSYKALFFATDPVAMDRIGWEKVDAKRVQEGMPPVAETGKQGKDPTGTEAFDFRQPQHIAGAGALGLGVYDRDKIEHRVIKMG
jgi:uncharacterized protein (DUF362 family)